VDVRICLWVNTAPYQNRANNLFAIFGKLLAVFCKGIVQTSAESAQKLQPYLTELNRLQARMRGKD